MHQFQPNFAQQQRLPSGHHERPNNTHPFNGPLSGTTRVSRYQKDFTEARDSEWQWHQLGHMQICTLLQTDNHASTPPLSFLQAGCPSCLPTNSAKECPNKRRKIHADRWPPFWKHREITTSLFNRFWWRFWHADKYWALTVIKFRIFKNQWPPSWKSQKSRNLYEIWYGDAKWVS